MKYLVLIFLLFSTQLIASENLTVTVKKDSLNSAVSSISLGDYNISLRLICVNASTDTVINKTFQQRYTKGQNTTALINALILQMQREINEYQDRHTLYNTAAFDNAISTIQSGLNGSAE